MGIWLENCDHRLVEGQSLGSLAPQVLKCHMTGWRGTPSSEWTLRPDVLSLVCALPRVMGVGVEDRDGDTEARNRAYFLYCVFFFFYTVYFLCCVFPLL